MTQASSTSRVNYFDHQFLRRQDFADEQTYQIAMRRRHNIAHHNWGIVVGLEVAVEEGSLVVRPGMAIDGYGRELFLPVKSPISSDDFLRLGSNRLDVWLFYENTSGADAPAGYVACGEDDGGRNYRTSERPRVFLERARAGRIDARKPRAVPAVVINSSSQLQTTDNPLVVWPIYLARVTFNREETDPSKVFLIDSTDRTYVGVMAETIDHPANAARLEVGKTATEEDTRTIGETTIVYKKNNERAFAVFVPSLKEKLDPRFEIDTNDNNYLRGTTNLLGNLLMAKGVIQFTEGTVPQDEAQRDDPMIYRALGEGDHLRIDLGKITDTERALVIGLTNDDGSFRPSMKLEYLVPDGGADPQPVLTIYGDLKLNGLITSAGTIERTLNEETLNALLASFQAGMGAAGRS